MMSIQRSVAAGATFSLLLLGSSACTVPGDPVADSPMLTDSVWHLQQIQYSDGELLTADPAANYTIDFMEDGQVSVQADCNRAIGEYTDNSPALSISLGPTTLAACSPDSIDGAYLQALNNASLYFFEGDQLYIDLTYDSGTMEFVAAPDTPMLEGTVWELQQIQYNDDTLVVADPPEDYTIEFMADGQVSVKADCNQAIGQFSASQGSQLSIDLGGVTRAACPPGSVSDDFLQALEGAAIYFFQNGDLYIDIQYDTGTMRFSAAN